MPLCLAELADLVGGQIHFGPMPPLHGVCTLVGDIALDSRRVGPGDVFWRIPGLACQSVCSLQHALSCGAGGVVVGEEPVTPWPGTFVLEVDDPAEALARVIGFLEGNAAQPKLPELKLLQLCPPQGPDITPATLDEPAEANVATRRCRRAA
jgi:UDP-N-acetylmuramyl pentapeptide synthase